jgi:type IV pilus assembly protein PilB
MVTPATSSNAAPAASSTPKAAKAAAPHKAAVTPEPEHFLQRIKLFSTLSNEECQQVIKRMKRRDFPPNTAIVREGAPGNSMFFITAGLVEVRKKDPNTSIDFLVTELGPGQNFGEMSLLTGKPRSASVIAVQSTTCAILEQAEFRELLIGYPKMGVALTTVLAERLEQATQHVGVDFINLSKLQIDPRVVALLPQQMMLQHRVIPVAFCNNRLTLAMVNPNNLIALDDIRRIIKGVAIEPVVTTEEDLRKFMGSTYLRLMNKPPAEGATPAVSTAAGPGTRSNSTSGAATASIEQLDMLQSDLIRDLQMAEENTAAETKQDLMSASEDAPIIRLGNSVLGLAIKKGASDIHIEPMEKEVVVRYRIDGVLQVIQNLPKKVQLGLISRLKIISKLDISEKRLPQDGRISVTMEGRPIDFRVSTIPGKWGEKVCMRILDKSNTTIGLDKLITHPPTLRTVRELIQAPYGIIYVTGPTGSGKTTTLYSALSEINEPGINISTAEDPIEYDLAGITQVQMNKDIGLDFARVLRAFLRQDPDVILVGETRDKETAHIAVEAALTGHLVFTTLHTNSAAGAFTRLFEMEIEPFLVSSSTIAVMAQRLCRRICKLCRQPYEPDEETIKYLDLQPDAEGKPITLYKKKGCSACNNSGFKGRVGIYEVLKLTPDIRTLVAKGSRTEEINSAALQNGMLDLKHYAGILLKEGHTTVEEVMSVVSMEE